MSENKCTIIFKKLYILCLLELFSFILECNKQKQNVIALLLAARRFDYLISEIISENSKTSC